MKQYHLALAGLRTVLRTPGEITISESLRPFLQAATPNTDCTITVRECPALPPLSENGTWHGPEYYDYLGSTPRVFHCSAPGAAAFAVTQLFENGNVEIGVLPSYLSYFTGSSGIFNRIGMETLLLQHSGLLLHASLIKYAGKAVAFTGPSGVGKSTHAAFWCDALGAELLNGDRAALRNTEAGWFAYGSPYAGTSGIYKNDSAPLAAVVVLQQAKENRLSVLTPEKAFRHLYPELSVHHWDKAFTEKAMDLCLQLIGDMPVYLLECLPQESAALLAKKGLGL